MQPLLVRGMGGMGDAIHQRALIRRWLELGFGPIWLETSHPELYWDFRRAGQVNCLRLGSPLRTQMLNEESALFDGRMAPTGITKRVIWYQPGRIKREGSLLKAMAGYSDAEGAWDISLPISPEWRARADSIIPPGDKPLMIVRPPVLRTEWNGPARNPDSAGFNAIVDSARGSFNIVSVADLIAGVEWTDGTPPAADLVYHNGELHFTTIAALMARPGTVVVSPPGFGLCMGRAVGAWTCGVFGSFELPAWWAFGTPKPERLITIAPVREIPDLELWNKELHCDKRINIPSAVSRFSSMCASAVAEFERVRGGVRLAEAAT